MMCYTSHKVQLVREYKEVPRWVPASFAQTVWLRRSEYASYPGVYVYLNPSPLQGATGLWRCALLAFLLLLLLFLTNRTGASLPLNCMNSSRKYLCMSSEVRNSVNERREKQNALAITRIMEKSRFYEGVVEPHNFKYRQWHHGNC